MRPELDVVQGVETESVLKSHHWWGIQKIEWVGKTLKVVFDGRGYMPELDKVAEELGTKSFLIYPWAIVQDVDKLDGFTIQAATRLDITCGDIENCKLIAGHALRVIVPKREGGVLKFVRNDVDSLYMGMSGINRGILAGNHLDKINRLVLTHIGPKIEKIVGGWNLLEIKNDKFSTWPRPKGTVDTSLDPLASLGLNKHFKNLDDFSIAKGTGGNDCYINVTKKFPARHGDWGIDRIVELNNGWQMTIRNDARCI